MVGTFVDTSAWYALRVSTDPAHRDARRILELLLKQGCSLHTSDWVVAETLALLANRVGKEEAVSAGRWILGTSSVRVHAVGEGLDEAWGLYQDLAGRVGLVDCGSFVTMRSQGLARAFAFDEDFAAQGFVLERPEAS